MGMLNVNRLISHKKTILAIITILILGLLAQACAPAYGTGVTAPAIGKVTDYRPTAKQVLAKNQPAPDLQIQMPDGKTVFLSDFRGKVVLLNFWATWCPYCIAEMPYLQTAYTQLSSKNVIFLGIDAGEPEKDVAKFAGQKKLTFPLILDTDTYMSLVYRANALPTTYVIDKTGKISIARVGAYSDANEIIADINTVIQQ